MKTYIDAGSLGEELEVEVSYEYTKCTPEVLYLSSGEPYSLGDSDEVKITSIFVVKYGFIVDLKEFNGWDYELLVEKIIESECGELKQ